MTKNQTQGTTPSSGSEASARGFARRAAVAVLTAALVGGVAGASTAVGSTAPDAPAGADRAELLQAMQTAVDAGVSGVQVRVADEQGEWTGSAGVRRLDGPTPPPTNGRFRIGSVSKTFTATVVLQLVAEGRLSLEDRVADHLPRFGLDPRITVRMLLQNTSGVPSYTGNLTPENELRAGIPMSGQTWVENRFRTYDAAGLVEFAMALEPFDGALFEPDEYFSYSNTNFTLATLLVEKITGSPYAQELERRVLDPLDLRGTSAPIASATIPGPHAHSYYRYYEDGDLDRPRTVDITRQNPSWAPGAGNMISTTEDLQAFLTALAAGELVPEPLLSEMTTPHTLAAYPDETQNLPYGLGIQRVDLSPFGAACDGVVVLNHNGGVPGSAALMYGTPDGETVLTASVTYVEEEGVTAEDAAARGLVEALLPEVFCR